MGHKNGNYSRQKERGNSASFRTFPAQNEASELVRAVMTMLSPLQGAGRLHLRRDGAGVPGGAGRGVPASDGGAVVRHDGLRRRLPQELQAL